MNYHFKITNRVKLMEIRSQILIFIGCSSGLLISPPSSKEASLSPACPQLSPSRTTCNKCKRDRKRSRQSIRSFVQHHYKIKRLSMKTIAPLVQNLLAHSNNPAHLVICSANKEIQETCARLCQCHSIAEREMESMQRIHSDTSVYESAASAPFLSEWNGWQKRSKVLLEQA